MSKSRFAWALAAFLFVTALVAPMTAEAACHFFTFSPNTYSVNEGAGNLTVTVRRDAQLAPSSVRVTAIDGSAKNGSDYRFEPNPRTVNFQTGVEQTITFPIIEDDEVEGTESFTLKLSNGGGCAPNPNFAYGPDATVTIQDNDQATTTTTAPAQTTTTTRPTTTTTTPTTTTIAEESPSPAEETAEEEPEPSPTDEVPLGIQDTPDDEGGGAPTGLLIALGGIAVAAAAGAGLWFLYRRGSTA